MRKAIRSLIIEHLEKEKLIREADMTAATDVFQTLWNLASAGFISYQFAKAVYNSYKSGKKTESEIEDMVQGLTIDYLKTGEDDDLDYLDKTIPYDMEAFNKTVDHEIDYDDTVVAQENDDDTLILNRDDDEYDFDEETDDFTSDYTLPVIDIDDEGESFDGSTQIKIGRRGDTRPMGQ